MNADLDYLDHLSRESARFVEAVRGAPADAPVPTCPDWNADDLLWHLAKVQWFWGMIVRERMSDPSRAEDLKPQRPADREGLLAFFGQASRDLGETLAATAPHTPAWTWSDDHTAGFIRRRQAHEALIHRLDAELTTSDRTPMDPQLSSDGVDEVLRVMYGGVPPWGSFSPDADATIRVLTTDTEGSWLVTLGRFTGTDPDDGTRHDEPELRIADAGAEPAATIQASAADLDSWLWRRPATGAVERSGDQGVLDAFESTISGGIG